MCFKFPTLNRVSVDAKIYIYPVAVLGSSSIKTCQRNPEYDWLLRIYRMMDPEDGKKLIVTLYNAF
jgi:hypothetical protein